MNKFFSMVNSLDFNWYVGIISKYIHLENIDFNNYFSEILSHTQLIKICCKSKELERNKEETKREFRGNSDDLYFMLIKPIYRLIVRKPKAFT